MYYNNFEIIKFVEKCVILIINGICVYRQSNQCISVSKIKMKEFFEPNVTVIREYIENALEKSEGTMSRLFF